MKEKKNQSQPQEYLEVVALVRSNVCLQMFCRRVNACHEVC